MKKTKRTAATAAMFATALNMALGSVTPDTAQLFNAKADEPDYEPSAEIQEDVYGPPEYFSTTTAEEAYDPATETETTMAVVYGPPSMMTTTYDPAIGFEEPLYGPPSFFSRGDLNSDGVTDVFDLIRLRKEFVESKTNGKNYAYSDYDVNSDGRLSIADLVALNRFILGKSSSLFYYNNYDPDDDPMPQPEYGAPLYFEETTTSETATETTAVSPQTETTTEIFYDRNTTTTTVTEPPVQPVYGPPSAFD
ncbi:MAG: dockerin type I repeat-containing protein [Ruminococcus sp.]|nr:dockerin type I repeat-containing protein [Ruminococcus sp.]